MYEKIIQRIKTKFPNFAVYTDADKTFDVYEVLSGVPTTGLRFDDTKGQYVLLYSNQMGRIDGNTSVATINSSALLFIESKCSGFDTILACFLGVFGQGCGVSGVTFTTEKRAIISRELAVTGLDLDPNRLNWLLLNYRLVRVDFTSPIMINYGNCPCEICDCDA